MMRIRRFAIGDEPRLHEVRHSSIHVLAARDYTLEQRLAWSPEVVDQALWSERVRGIQPFIVEIDEPDGPRIAAYGDVQADGYIDHFYVSGTYGSRGVGTRLMNHLLATARAAGIRVLTSDVSLTAQGFFARFGFVIVRRQWPVARGVTMENAKMRLDLDARAA
jgi:putative acetyltransferase